MLVLDILRDIHDDQVEIAPFHTGHLGFLPGTEVSLGLLNSERSDLAELVVTPFKQSHGQMARLVCVMKDKPGAVRALARAIAKLGINIVIQESGSINSAKHHLVSMILDWSTAQLYFERRAALPATIARYEAYRGRFPIHEDRYV